jgi:hypothetical protein
VTAPLEASPEGWQVSVPCWLVGERRGWASRRWRLERKVVRVIQVMAGGAMPLAVGADGRWDGATGGVLVVMVAGGCWS